MFQAVLKRLIIDGHANGEIADGDPDQLVIVIVACFDGLSRLALRDPQHFADHFPEAAIILRMLSR